AAFAGTGFHDPLAPAQVPGRAARSGGGPQAARRRSRTAAGVSAAGQQVEYVLLLGRRDLPTDGVRDYAGLLAAELRARGAQAEVVEADWGRHGWRRALAQVWRAAAGSGTDRWVLLQYTHLAWARHGFPLM